MFMTSHWKETSNRLNLYSLMKQKKTKAVMKQEQKANRKLVKSYCNL